MARQKPIYNLSQLPQQTYPPQGAYVPQPGYPASPQPYQMVPSTLASQVPHIPRTVYTHQRRRQSVGVHIVLALTTCGIGNILYVKWANSDVAARFKA